MTTENPFENAHVVSVYTDAQAVDDGVLVAINPRDRVTRAVWDYLTRTTPMTAKPPNRWPVDLMTWFRAPAGDSRDSRALALAKGLIGTYQRQARKVYDENIGGGIFCLYALTKLDQLAELSETEPNDEAHAVNNFEGNETSKLWLIPNENGGVTLLFPDDY
jgi:hypothetical protein